MASYVPSSSSAVAIHDGEPPEVVRARTPHPQTGRLSLHEECIVTLDHDPSEERIDELLRLNPEAANTRDTEGSLPIDILIRTGANHKNPVSRDVIRALVRASPSFCNQRGGILTVADCKETANTLFWRHPDWTDLLIAFVEVHHLLLFQRSEDPLMSPVLHRACKTYVNTQRIHFPHEVIQAIINVHPRAVQEFFSSDDPYENDWLPLHTICHFGGPVESVRIIIHAYPAALTITDYYGCLPIHLACQRVGRAYREKNPRLDVIGELVQEAPETLLSRANIANDFHNVVLGPPLTPLQMLFLGADDYPNNSNTNDDGFNNIVSIFNNTLNFQGSIVDDADGLSQTDIVEYLLRRAIEGNHITPDTIQGMFEEYPAASDIYKYNSVTHNSMFSFALEQLSTTTTTTTVNNHHRSSNIVSIVGYFLCTRFPSPDILSKLLFGDDENNDYKGSSKNVHLYLFRRMVLHLHKHYINNSINNSDDEDNNKNRNDTGMDESNSKDNNDVDAADDDTTNSITNNNNNAAEELDIGSTNILYSVLRRDPNIIETYGHCTDN